jgi:gliding motility-associated-like protein
LNNGVSAGATQTITATPVAGISTYYVTGTDALGCYNTDSIKVNGIPVPTFNIKDTTNCAGIEIELDGRPTNIPGYETMNPAWQWKNNTTVLADTDSILNVNTAGTYIAILTIDQCTGTDTADVVINPVPTDGLAADTYYCEATKDSILLTAGAGTGLTYAWGTTSATNNLGTAQTQMVYTPAEYFLTITNAFNCSRTDSINVRDVCEPTVFIPTGFSPDGKGVDVNNTWVLYAKYTQNFKLTIFNRWGEIIFYTEDPNISWDGNYRGEPMPIGVYPYILTYEGQADEFKGPFKTEGAVTIVR